MKGVNPDNGFTAPQLKPCFYLFQSLRPAVPDSTYTGGTH